MDVVKLKSGSKFEDLSCYSRLVAVGDWIFVSNTAGRDYASRSISPDAGEQAERAFQTIEGALAAVGSDLSDVVRVIVTVPNPADREAVRKVIASKFKDIDPASTTHAATLANPELKVEIEVTAYRGLGKLPQKRLRVQL